MGIDKWSHNNVDLALYFMALKIPFELTPMWPLYSSLWLFQVFRGCQMKKLCLGYLKTNNARDSTDRFTETKNNYNSNYWNNSLPVRQFSGTSGNNRVFFKADNQMQSQMHWWALNQCVRSVIAFTFTLNSITLPLGVFGKPLMDKLEL